MENQAENRRLEVFVHQEARSLLRAMLEAQPQLLTGRPGNADGGKGAGEFINALYDQLVVLTRKSLSPEFSPKD